jgi:hypothetical protein
MIRKEAKTGAFRHPRIGQFAYPHQSWMTHGPGFEVAGRYGKSDALNSLNSKLGRERARNQLHARIPNLHRGSVCDSCCHCAALETPKGFPPISVREIPGHFPQADGVHPAKQSGGTGFEQAREIARELRQVFYAV